MGDKEFENFTKHEERKEAKNEDPVDQPSKRQLQQGLYQLWWINYESAKSIRIDGLCVSPNVGYSFNQS